VCVCVEKRLRGRKEQAPVVLQLQEVDTNGASWNRGRGGAPEGTQKWSKLPHNGGLRLISKRNKPLGEDQTSGEEGGDGLTQHSEGKVVAKKNTQNDGIAGSLLLLVPLLRGAGYISRTTGGYSMR